MREAVRGRVARRVVERNRRGSKPLDRRPQPGPNALVVRHDLGVRTQLLDARCVVAPDDRHPLARAREQERALPGAVRAGDEVEARIPREERLADERQPEIDALLLEDRRRLVELLAHERRRRCHAQTLAVRRRSDGDPRPQSSAQRCVCESLLADTGNGRRCGFESRRRSMAVAQRAKAPTVPQRPFSPETDFLIHAVRSRRGCRDLLLPDLNRLRRPGRESRGRVEGERHSRRGHRRRQGPVRRDPRRRQRSSRSTRPAGSRSSTRSWPRWALSRRRASACSRA